MERTRVYLATEYPFYASMLAQCTVGWSTAIPTAGVRVTKTGNVEMLVNRDFFYSLSERHRVGLLMHEMLHLAMKHLTRGRDLDKQRANIAMDIAINQYIPKDLLPPGALLPNQFGFEPGKAFEVYYAELLKRQPPKQKPLDDHNWDSSPSNDAGDSSSAGQDKQQDDKQQPDQQKQDANGSSGDKQDQQDTGGGLSDEMKDAVLDQLVKSAAKEANGRSPGSIPQHVQQVMDAAVARKAAINWKQRLRSYIGRRYSADRETTRNRPNRRLGFRAPGYRSLEAPKILIGVDESGSVSNEMLSQLLSEVKWILEAIKDKTEVVFFDVEIAHSAKLDKLTDTTKRYAGGGTSFQCVIDHANKTRPDLLIMLTDGDAPAPTQPCCQVLWVLIGGNSGEHLKGTKIRIDQRAAD